MPLLAAISLPGQYCIQWFSALTYSRAIAIYTKAPARVACTAMPVAFSVKYYSRSDSVFG